MLYAGWTMGGAQKYGWFPVSLHSRAWHYSNSLGTVRYAAVHRNEKGRGSRRRGRHTVVIHAESQSITASRDGQSDRMNPRLLLWAITSSLAGFLFGFDTVVISGAEQTIQSLWGLSAAMHGVAMAAALYGTVIGSLFGGWPADRYGRKVTLLWIGVLYIVSAVGCAVSWNVSVFIIARLLGGIGIGVSTVVAPLYIAEIAPATHRGRLTGMFQFNIVFGIVMAFLSNALLAGVGINAWRWMLGVAAIPSVIYAVMCLFIPESPRWLLTRNGDRARGLQVLGLIEPQASA